MQNSVKSIIELIKENANQNMKVGDQIFVGNYEKIKTIEGVKYQHLEELKQSQSLCEASVNVLNAFGEELQHNWLDKGFKILFVFINENGIDRLGFHMVKKNRKALFFTTSCM